MKNAGLAGAIALCGIGLIMIGLGNFVSTPRAMAAAPAVAPGDGEPTIVAFGSLGLVHFRNNSANASGFYRLWSDGRTEVRYFKINQPWSASCSGNEFIVNGNGCSVTNVPIDTGWIEVPPPPGGEGYACRSDLNGDRRVNGADLATLLSQWGDGVSCDPQPTYPCFDLGNLNLPAVAMN